MNKKSVQGAHADAMLKTDVQLNLEGSSRELRTYTF